MTVVKVCGITRADQAFWALEAGATMLGFVMAPSRRQIHPSQVAEILSLCHRLFPRTQLAWQAVGVFANQPPQLVQQIIEEAGVDLAQLSGSEPPSYCRRLQVPVLKTIHLPPAATLPGPAEVAAVEMVAAETDRPTLPGSAQLSRLAPSTASIRWSAAWLETVRLRYGAWRLLLDTGTSRRWGGTGRSFRWDQVGKAARDCMVAGGLSPKNVLDAIALMHPWGVDVSSGVEKDGTKDRDLIRSFVRQVKGVDQDVHFG